MRSESSCAHAACDRLVHSRGYCGSHYNTARAAGLLPTPTPESRFWKKVDTSGDCWLWTGSTTRGYGTFHVDGKSTYAHRYSYELHVGEIPEGAVIDHKCHAPSCVNPEHLHSVSQRENIQNRRGANSNSTSGHRGVHRSGGRWVVAIADRGRVHHGGFFDDIGEAAEAARKLRLEIFPNSLTDRRVS